MRFCPKCRSEFQDWAKECHVCHVPLVDHLPAAQQPVASAKPAPIRDEIVTVATFFHPEEAHIVSAKLEAEGIQSFVSNDNMAGLYYLSPCINEGARVQVFESEAEDARRILDSVTIQNQATPSIGNACPKCKSEDTSYGISLRDIFVLWITTLISNSAFPFLTKKWKCRSCGYSWRS